ncbi:MAG TPA: tetratricopeptide repeat protein, partial [Candidatus Eisenbacteria bacterium]|nr:tetratricopeptide repeat protein [Candidatus Eisenbacteria bacterium]
AADPGHWLGLLAKKSYLYVNRQEENVNGSLELEKEHVWVLRAAAVPFNLLVWLGVLGLVLAWREARRGVRTIAALAVPLTLIVATFLTCILFFVITRLRLPAVPILAVFSAFALTRAFDLWPGRERKPVLAGALGVLLLTALTWTSPLGVPRNPAWEASLVLEGAKALENKGERERAADMYRLAGAVNPVSVDALLGEAEAAMRAGDMARTISLYERARNIAPDRFAVRNNLGILYFNAGNLEASAREMEEASRLEPRAASPYLYLIQILNALGKSEEAQAWQERARQAGVDLSVP